MPGPINAIYGETVAGTAVIRAFGLQSVFIDGSFALSYPLCFKLIKDLLRNMNMQINSLALRLYMGRWLFGQLTKWRLFLYSLQSTSDSWTS